MSAWFTVVPRNSEHLEDWLVHAFAVVCGKLENGGRMAAAKRGNIELEMSWWIGAGRGQEGGTIGASDGVLVF